jgi:hypothetical protein
MHSQDLRQNIALSLHDQNTHLGFQRLCATCKPRYYFKNMYQFLREHVLTCQVCQEVKRPTHPPQVPLQATPMARPFARWIMDCHGPFSDSPDANSDPKKPNRYVIAFIDQCTLWPELCAVPDITGTDSYSNSFRPYCCPIRSPVRNDFTIGQR